jgi:NADH-quinone oxidoreductase subunit E
MTQVGDGHHVMDTERRRSFHHPAPPLSEAWHARARGILARYPDGQARSALLSLLYLAQAEHGFVSGSAMSEIAELLGLTRAEVQAVATFYTMFKREPQGRWLVSVCTQPSCALAGGTALKDRLEGELGIACGETTPDGAVSLEEVECLCACDGAPVFSVNYENFEGVPADDAVAMVASLRDGGAPPPGARGVAPPDFAAINDEMAGRPGRRAR